MYDYATYSNQIQIMNKLDTVNSNLENITNGIQYTGILIASIILMYYFKKFVYKMLGGK